MSGIICGNYGFNCNGGQRCQGAWHAGCFHLKENDPFPKALTPRQDLLEKGGITDWAFTKEELDDRKDEFTRTFGGAHLSCPFQCADCHYYNIHIYLPADLSQVALLKKTAIKRALLDAFGARAESTIVNNAAKIRELLLTCN
mmetsp:Transcript_17848/g.27061  ORF Transcript_17848/g.27061 Transcript_17848/m.27061 type:complete len:143 (+) Transcript_17848:89-517(+)